MNNNKSIIKEEYKKNLLKLLKKEKNDDKLFRKYIDICFESIISVENAFLGRRHVNKDDDIECINMLLKKYYDFFRQKSPDSGSAKVLVKNYSLDNNFEEVEDATKEKFATFIFINIKDQPFLVDSFILAVNNFKLQVESLTHFTAKVVRGVDGNILDLCPIHEELPEETSKQKSIITKESLIAIEISDIVYFEKRQELYSNLVDLVRDVAAVDSDFIGSLSKVDSIVKQIETYNIDSVGKVNTFLEWLKKDNFIFLGYHDLEVKEKGTNLIYKEIEGSAKGILRVNENIKKDLLEDLTIIDKKIEKTDEQIKGGLLELVRSMSVSEIHKGVHIEIIRVKHYSSKKNIIGESRIYGLFTSKVDYTEVLDIPLISEKVEYVLGETKFVKSSYNMKEVISIMSAYPKVELFQISQELFYQHVLEQLEFVGRNKMKLLSIHDKYNRYIAFLCYIPKGSFVGGVRGRIESLLESETGGRVVSNYTQVTDNPLTRGHILVDITAKEDRCKDLDIADLDSKLDELVGLWADKLQQEFRNNQAYHRFDDLYNIYHNVFPHNYVRKYRPQQAFEDIFLIDSLIHKKKPKEENASGRIFKLSKKDISEDAIYVKLYQLDEPMVLSYIIPIIEAFGLQVIDEEFHEIKPVYLANKTSESYKVYIYVFTVKPAANIRISKDKGKDHFINVEKALCKAYEKKLRSDNLNSLIVTSDINWEYVKILRVYLRYAIQLKLPFGYQYMVNVLTSNYDVSLTLLELFEVKFQLNKDSVEVRKKKIENIHQDIKKKLSKVSNVTEDRIIKFIISLIDGTLRTNFYQKEGDKSKYYISIKVDLENIDDVPLPKTYREIFVYAGFCEGIHLRGGAIARGGLRWSDRQEDFRTEVLGLMKAQMTKNAVIVPVGSKGGFVITKNTANLTKEEYKELGITSYKTLLKGILDITDNIINGKICTPEGLVVYDKEDPYLAVAADKGTATFSDIANGISEDYGFWLRDAFASGGSNGYDHKKMGITAKGAWIAVQRHFMERKKDIQTEEFTVVGIGGMGGDVFGNGMLLSETIQLVAAFNHEDIFLDPNPNCQTSYKERQRLFKGIMGWGEYSPKKISQGGGVYKRHAKEITLSKEVKTRLGITKDSLSGDQLIQYILKANVDLIWNGGIGTYIKAKKESDADVMDVANDNVRVDAEDVRAKVIGEGGNLGITQKARIVFGLRNGGINTDAMDNVGGVNSSDREVNIKIALAIAEDNNLLKKDKRNKLLASLTNEIEQLVLEDCRRQTFAISIESNNAFAKIDQHKYLMDYLEKIKFLNKEVEYLPSDKEIIERQRQKNGLSRAEICIIFSYTKMYIYNNIIESDLVEDDYFDNIFYNYFPKKLVDSVGETNMITHKLKKEIIATLIVNDIVDYVGVNFVHDIKTITSASYIKIVQYFIIVVDILDLKSIWKEIPKISLEHKETLQFDVQEEIKGIIEKTILWFIYNFETKYSYSNISNILDHDIIKKVRYLKENIGQFMNENMQEKVKESKKTYKKAELEDVLINKIVTLKPLFNLLFIIDASENYENLIFMGKVYFKIEESLKIDNLESLASSGLESKWQKISYNNFKHQLFKEQGRITKSFLSITNITEGNLESNLTSWNKENVLKMKKLNKLYLEAKNNEQYKTDILNGIIRLLQSI